jgi:PAS domain S-box-containing protein
MTVPGLLGFGRSGRKTSIATSLALFGIAVLLPVSAGGGLLAARLAHDEQDRLEEQARDVARDIAGDIDRELQGVVASLEALSTSPALADGNLGQFYRQAQKALAFRGSAIVVRDASGQQLLNTLVPWGAPLPVSTDPVLRAADESALRTGMPVISDLYVGAVSRKPYVLVDVPVRRGEDEPALVLNMALSPERLQELVKPPGVPPEWVVGLLDGSFRIITRSRDAERFVGQTATAFFRDHVLARDETWRGMLLDGTPVLSSWAPSSMAAWRVAVAVPVTMVDSPLRALLWTLGGLVALGLACSLGLALVVGRRVAGPVRQLAEAAVALGRGQSPVLPQTRIAEIQVIASAMAGAAEELRARTRERDEALALALDSERRLRATAENAGAGIAEIDAEGRFAAVNETICRITGYPRDELLGRRFATLSDDEDVRGDLSEFERQREGQHDSYVVEKRFLRKDGEIRWVRIFSSAVRDEDNLFAYAVRVVLDVTEERRAAEHQQLLVAELNHRVKNTLAIVQSLVLQTLKSSESPEAFRQALTGRILALARSHDLLSASDWKGTTLDQIARLTLAPHGGPGRDALVLEGPPVPVGTRSVVSLSLLLHELATNAVKYGALGPRHGSLAVRWWIEDGEDARLVLAWDERWSGGDVPEAKSGFGSRLVELITGQELKGGYTREFGAGFARYRFDVSLATLTS